MSDVAQYFGSVHELGALGQFLCGVSGSIAYEAASATVISKSEDWTLPPHYRRFSFWVLRAIVAAMAGGLAVAYSAPTMLLCFHIGVSAPVILQSFARNAPKMN